MQGFKKIVVLDNEIQARLMDSVLTERDIPHRLRSYHDSAYDGIYQMQKGWGHVEAPAEYEDEIESILANLPVQDVGNPEDSQGGEGN
jgi:hypothetical protein